MDFISFDLQSTHLSYEERRWLYEQRKTKSIDKMLNEMDELHKMIISYPNFSQTEYVPLTPMNDTDVLYYQTLVDEATDNKIDLFRLHRLQMIQSLFKDFDDHLFKHFTIIIEGYIFYASQTVELRYIDYETNLKWKRHHQPLAVISKPTIQKHSTGLYGDLAVTVQHSLSIIYPYNDKIVFNKKYPQYWQQESQNETDNDSEDALFKLVSIEKDSGEYAYMFDSIKAA
ncbi:unnamed protein product [Didymodactylos carnosus]|uniref:Uncharacterized protein n=1 Tax=Didymodactylos carnosus TaxID=1234261 RepID=A0A815W061_9BILA|nr:unnamed protein product [Didymodactylos carnosus]CAF4394354.1 unnamed protein product [Didymodactylos carnosus]